MSENYNPSKGFSLVMPISMGLFAFLFFVTTRARQHDRDTLYRLLEIDGGSVASMTEPRHVLFSPITAGFYGMWKFLGYKGSALLPGQVLVAAAGAIGIFLITLMLARLCSNRTVFLLLSAAFAGSYSYWYHATDVEYWIPYIAAALAVTIFFAKWIYDGQYALGLTGVIFFTYVSILFWAAGVVLGLLIAISFLILPSQYPQRKRWLAFLIFGISEAILLTVSYAWLGFKIHGVQTYSQLAVWLTTYPGRLPIWGVADPKRFLNSAWSLAASVLPFWDGMGLRGLMRGEIDPTRTVPQLALLTTLVLLGAIGTSFARNKPDLPRTKPLVPLFLLWIVAYGTFITWFDPFEPKWWIIVLIPIWMLLAETTDRWVRQVGWPGFGLLGAWVVLLFLANWSNSMGPRSLDDGNDYRRAQYALDRMAADDVLVAPQFMEWPLYVEYFGNRKVVNLGGLAAAKGVESAKQALLDLACADNEDVDVYLADFTMLSAKEWQFISDNMGITPSVFDGLEYVEAWRWGEEPVWQIVGSRDCSPP